MALAQKRFLGIVAASVFAGLVVGCGANSAIQPPATQPLLRSAMSTASSPTSYEATVLADGPLAYYRLDETSGTVITDASGHGHTGTLSGSATYGAAGALSGDADSAMGFNGSNTWISGSLPGLNTHYSFEAWVKTGWLPEGHIIDVSPQQLLIVGGQFAFGEAGHYLKSPLSTYGDNQFHHVVATYDGATKRLYVDGALVNSAADSMGAVNGSSLAMGHYFGGGNLFQGSLDEVALYGQTLSPAQVLNHDNVGRGSTASPSPTPSSTPSSGPTPTPTPTSTATANPVVPHHVLTSDYVGGANGTALAPSSLGPWLSWAETGWQDNPAIRAAGIKAMIYSDPNRTTPGEPLFPAVEAAFAHTCAGARITTTGNSSLYLMNPASSVMATLWNAWIVAESAGIRWDAVFDDDTNDVAQTSGTPCGFSSSAWLAATEAELAAVSPAPIIYNGLQMDNEISLNSVSNVLGGMEEGCYADSNAIPNIFDPYWTQIENTEISMAAQGKLFMCLGRDSQSASTAISSRIYTYASFLLSYNPSRSVLWDLYDTPSGFHVEPETKLVALNPLVSQPGDISQLKLSTGLYGREYADCYLAGVLVGPCAAVVNPDRSHSYSYPYGSKYAHTLVLNGGGILDGGSVGVTGPAPGSSLGPTQAIVVFR